MSLKKVYSFRVQPQEVDFRYKITLSALSNILLTTAGYNADENGFGIRRLNEMDATWVLIRFAVEMIRFPEQYEEIHIETWIEEVGRASTTRNFSIRDSKNSIIGNCSSNWVMLDLKTRKAKDLLSLEGIHNFETGEVGLIEKPLKLDAVNGKDYDGFKVKYSDIDINGHVSSTRYIQWISDCFSLDCYKKHEIKRFEFNFMNEMFYDDFVEITGEELEPFDFRFEISKDMKTACRARVLF